ncbi:MAG: tetratricopeptide repeat protein [Chthoniobacteraceae bacterium]
MPAAVEPARFHVNPNDRWMAAGVVVFLAVIVWVVFGQALGFGFINYDDPENVSRNAAVIAGLGWKGIAWAFTHTVVGRWAPVTVMSHMLDCQIYGLWAGGHVLTNVLLHGVTAIVLFLVLWRMTGALWRGAFVAAVFAIHPLRVEAICWISARGDVLDAFFFVLTLGAYLGYVRRPQSRVRYWAVALVFALGLMAKSMIVTLPFVLLLLDYWPLNRFPKGAKQEDFLRAGRRLVVEKIPLFVLAVMSCVATVLATRGVHVDGIENDSILQRVCNALISYAIYLRQMVYPAGLAIPYITPVHGVSYAQAGLALLVLAGISYAAWYLRRMRPWLAVGWLWYVGMLAPVTGIVQISYYSHADRYTDLPQIGLGVIVAWGVAEMCAGLSYRRILLGGVSAAAIVAMVMCARVQASYWHDDETLWRHAIACTADNYMATSNLGNALLKNGQADEAMATYRKAMEINPEYAVPYYNMGLALFQKGDVDDAIANYEKAIAKDADYADPENNLGNALMQKGAVDEAISHYRRAAEIKPGLAEVQYNLGGALMQKGATDDAVASYQKAIELEPGYAEAECKLGDVFLRGGRTEQAIAHYQRAIEMRPGFVEAETNLGTAFVQKGEIDQGIAHYQKAVGLKPEFAEAHYDLANAFLQRGEEGEALAHFQRVLELQPQNIQAGNNMALLLATSTNGAIRNGGKAVDLAERMNRIAGGRQPVILVTLAAAYAEAGRFPKAVETAQRALQLANGQGLSETIQSHIRLYQSGTPLRIGR